MPWIDRLPFSELYRRLPRGAADRPPPEERIDAIRTAMLDTLGEHGAAQYPQVARRVRASADALALWYARADLMSALSGLCGEQQARVRMAGISAMFDGMLPKSMAVRHTSLRG